MFVVSAGFKTIWVDLLRFCWNLIICCWCGQILHDFNDLADRSGFGSIWGYLNLAWWIWLELFDFLWFRAVWVDLGDFNRFDSICVDLKGLRWIYLEDRYNLICVGFEWFRWMRVETATYLDGSGKIWLTLRGFDWNWADSVGCGRRYVWIPSWTSLFIVGFNWIIKGFGWI